MIEKVLCIEDYFSFQKGNWYNAKKIGDRWLVFVNPHTQPLYGWDFQDGFKEYFITLEEWRESKLEGLGI